MDELCPNEKRTRQRDLAALIKKLPATNEQARRRSKEFHHYIKDLLRKIKDKVSSSVNTVKAHFANGHGNNQTSQPQQEPHAAPIQPPAPVPSAAPIPLPTPPQTPTISRERMQLKLMEALESSNKTLWVWEQNKNLQYSLRWAELLELAHRLEGQSFGELQAEHQCVAISLEQLMKGIRKLDEIRQLGGFKEEVERYHRGY